METKNIGLRGIEVADTKISNIDGGKGKLIYRGFDILDLTGIITPVLADLATSAAAIAAISND